MHNSIKTYLALVGTSVVLAGGAYLAQLSFVALHTPPATTAASTTTTEKVSLAGPAPRQTEVPASTPDAIEMPLQTATATPPLAPAPNITLSVASTSYAVHISAGTNVLDVMRALASSSDFTFDGREYPALGFFVDSINGKREGGGYVWILHINGSKATKGISVAILAPGDSVEWKYEKSY